MKYIHQTKTIRILLVLFAMLFSLASCNKGGNSALSPSVINPLFVSANVSKTSLQNGNLYYNNFLTSDGSYLYFQSADGKSLVKSDYNGDNSVVLCNQFPSYLNVVDNMVYFVEGSKSGKVYKVDINGQGQTLVIDSNVESLIVTADYMFFIDTKDGYPYYSLHDGSEIRLLLNKVTTKIQLVNDTLYFQLAEENNGVYSFPIENLEAVSTPTPAIGPISDVDAPSAAETSSAPVITDSIVDSSETASEEAAVPTATPVVTNVMTPYGILFKELRKSDIVFFSTNIKNDRFFYIDHTNNSYIMVSENKNEDFFLKKSLLSPFIISDEYLFYINPDDESRIYRISLKDSSDNKMVVNDRVAEFVVCGNSIYYRRESNLEIFRAAIGGGLSEKIT